MVLFLFLSLYFLCFCNAKTPPLYITVDGEITTNNVNNPETISSGALDTLRTQESLALQELYTTLQGNTWRDSNYWMQNHPCGTKAKHYHDVWSGLQCNSQRLVTDISLAANQLRGTIPNVWTQLTQLKQLDLSLNHLKGAVPSSLGALKLLTRLDLGYNYLLLSLRHIGKLHRLQYLSLRWNTLITGSLVDLSSLTQLHTLILRDNQMESLTLEGIAPLTALTTVDFTKSGLRGELDPAYLSGLIEFHASNNRLSGTLFSLPSAATLSSLVVLDLSENMLSGAIPRLKSAVNLKNLDLSNNAFVHNKLVLSEHVQLRTLKLNANRLEQPFFYDLYKLTHLEIFGK